MKMLGIFRDRRPIYTNCDGRASIGGWRTYARQVRESVRLWWGPVVRDVRRWLREMV